MKRSEADALLDERIREAYERFEGCLADIARAVEKPRSTVWSRLQKMGMTKPLVAGSLDGVETTICKLPKKGQIKRYILTSAQNNTKLNEDVWKSLLALREHYGAELLIGTFSSNQNAFGQMSVKKDTIKHDKQMWYDKNLEPYFCDKRLELGRGLVWCGEMNIIPTADDPLSGLETYSHRKSAIFPHAKMAMRSIATMKNEGTKMNYTTGTVTCMNYIQKKAGLKGEHHHIYGALLVEVDSDGHWWVRQLDADSQGTIYDLNLKVEDGKVTPENRIESITWGDFHFAKLDPMVQKLSIEEGGMLDTLHPFYQFGHDIIAGMSPVSHHTAENPHETFRSFTVGMHSVENEMQHAAEHLSLYQRDWCEMFIVDSNHDGAWVYRWLRENDYRRDPVNALIFLETQLAVYKSIQSNEKLNVIEWMMRRYNCPKSIRFLGTDESFLTCGRKIENGMHGHLGPNGARGTPANLNKVGRRANTGHTHSAGIWNGLYVAGTSTLLDFGYNSGPSSWSHSHIVTYPNGKRAIITMYAGKWRA